MASFTKFIAAKETGDDFELNKIRKIIDEDKAFPLKDWFYEKFNELNKKGAN